MQNYVCAVNLLDGHLSARIAAVESNVHSVVDQSQHEFQLSTSHQDDRRSVDKHSESSSPLVIIGALCGGFALGVAAALSKPRKGYVVGGSASGDDGEATPEHPRANKVGAFDPHMAGATEGLRAPFLRFAKRRGWHWLGRVMQIQQRFGDIQGSNVAAAVALQTFLALFPMLLVAAAIIGFIMNDQGGEFASRVISEMGLTGSAASTMNEALTKAAENRKAASLIGFVTLVWSALGVSSAIQYALNQSWQTTPRGIADKLVGAAWLSGAAILFVGTLASTTLLSWLPAGAGIGSIAIGIFLSFVLWMFTGKVLPNVKVPLRSLIPGSIVGVLGMEALKLLGTLWVPKMVASSSGLYGTIGIVFAVLAWVILFGKLVVYATVTNVVLHEARHGVSLGTIELPKPAVPKAIPGYPPVRQNGCP